MHARHGIIAVSVYVLRIRDYYFSGELGPFPLPSPLLTETLWPNARSAPRLERRNISMQLNCSNSWEDIERYSPEIIKGSKIIRREEIAIVEASSERRNFFLKDRLCRGIAHNKKITLLQENLHNSESLPLSTKNDTNLGTFLKWKSERFTVELKKHSLFESKQRDNKPATRRQFKEQYDNLEFSKVI